MAVLSKESVLIYLESIQCGACGGVYAINQKYYLQKKKYGGSWTCPYAERLPKEKRCEKQGSENDEATIDRPALRSSDYQRWREIKDADRK